MEPENLHCQAQSPYTALCLGALKRILSRLGNPSHNDSSSIEKL